MNPPDAPAEPPRETRAREAAGWFARMRGPDAADSRSDFDTWLAQAPEHRGAYNRAAEIFAMGKLLADADRAAPAPAPEPRKRAPVAALLAICAASALAGGWFVLRPTGVADRPNTLVAGAKQERRELATVPGEVRLVRLADGSTVRLGGGTRLEVTIDGVRRILRLTGGAARFEVAHEARPFIVLAAGGSVTARGTIFDVALTGAGRVDVHLLEGAVDVRVPASASGADNRVRRLAAGEALSFAALPKPVATLAGAGIATPTPTASASPDPVREFEGATVATLVAEANRGSPRPISIANSSLGARRVSGRFRVDDTGLLAPRIGALLGARVDTRDPKRIVLGLPENKIAPPAP